METNTFLKPLLNHWRKILGLAILGALMFSAYSLTIPKTYRVAVVLESPYTGNSYLDAMVNIKAYLETNIYTQHIATTCGVDPKTLVFGLSQPRDSSLISISLDTSDLEKGREILSTLLGQLSANFQNVINIALIKNEQEVTRLNADLAAQRNEIAVRQKQLIQLDAVEKNINTLAMETRHNTDKLIGERDVLFKSQSPENNQFSLLMYSNTVQQSVAYLSDINRQLLAVQQQIQTHKLAISAAEAAIRKMQAELNSVTAVRESIRNIKTLSATAPTEDPIGPRKRMYAIAGLFLGLLLGLVSAYGFEMFYKPSR